jgi:hypothetical protein
MKRLVLAVALLPVVALAQVRPATEAEIALVQKALEAHLTDPESMRLRNVRAGPLEKFNLEEVDGDGAYTVCGEVNAKNRFGGYAGFHVFFADYFTSYPFNNGDPGVMVYVIDDGRMNLASKACAEKGF